MSEETNHYGEAKALLEKMPLPVVGPAGGDDYTADAQLRATVAAAHASLAAADAAYALRDVLDELPSRIEKRLAG